MVELNATLQGVCHGDWGDGGQNHLQCTLKDVLLDSYFIAQLIDWQNVLFLLFMPLMLAVASAIFRATYKAMGAPDLDQVLRSAGALVHNTPMPYYPQRTIVSAPQPRPVIEYQQSPVQSIPVQMLVQHVPMHAAIGHVFDPAVVQQELFVQRGGDYMAAGARFGSEHQVDGAAGPQELSLQFAFVEKQEDVSGVSFGRPLDNMDMPGARELQPLAASMSARPADTVDSRNIAVMISLAGYIFSIGLICWASVCEFVDPQSPDQVYAQGWATQSLKKGQIQRGINLGWALAWLSIGSIFMTVSQLLIRTVVVGWLGRLDMVDFVSTKGNIAVSIYEAGMQISLGMVCGAAISGPPSRDGFGIDFAGFVLFYVLSFVVLILFSLFFDLYTTEWDTWLELKRGNEAAGISNFCQLVCSAMLMSNAVSKSFELPTFFGWFATGTLARLIFRTLLDYLLVAPRLTDTRYTFAQLKVDNLIKKNNWGTALVVGWLQLVFTRIINTFLPAFCWDFIYVDGRTGNDMPLREKLIATEYIFTAWHWEKLIALAMILCIFILARIPFEMRMRLQLAGVLSNPADGAPVPVETNLNYYIFENRLNAVNIAFGGYLVAVGNFMCGVFNDVDYNVSFAALNKPSMWGSLWIQIGVGNFMVIFSLMVNDIYVLHKYRNMVEMAVNDNKAVALIEAGALIGSSFIIEACVKNWDYSDPPWASSVILFLVAQALIIIFQLLFESATVYNDEQEVALGNSAAGLFNGLNLVAVGLVLARCVHLSHSIVAIVSWAVITFPLLMFVHKVLDRIVLPDFEFEAAIECLDRTVPNIYHPRRSSKQGNWGVALIAGVITISFANLLSTMLRDCVYLNGVPSLVKS